MPKNNSGIGICIIGLIFFLGFGVFSSLRSSPFSLYNIMPLFPMIFIIFIIVIAGVGSASSKRSKHSKNSTCCSPKSHNQYQYITPKVPKSNPYIVKASSSSIIRPIYIEDNEPEKPKTNFCQYCGTRKDRNAIYCHSCGTKLE
ncbi:MAG: hypothetical protein ACTSPZ_04115 [Promethearchaeota archaeon]